MKAVVLSAGLGTRLAPLTDATPKILLEIAGEALLVRQVRYLREQGIEEIAVNAHHHWEQVEAFAAELGIDCFVEQELLGTAGALWPMRSWLGEEPFVLLYGDTLTDARIDLLAAALGDLQAVLACFWAEDASSKGLVLMDQRGVVGFKEKPISRSPGLVFGGLAVVRPQAIPAYPDRDWGHDVWPMLALQRTLGATVLPGARFHDIGTPEALAAAW